MHSLRRLRLLALAFVAVLALAACATDEEPVATDDTDSTEVEDEVIDEPDDDPVDEPEEPVEEPAEEPAEAELAAEDLRATLNNLLAEHVFFAGAAVNEALQGNEPAFEAAAEALDRNSQDLAGAVGLVYGDEAGDAFLGLWRSHIDMFVDYTVGVATDNDEQANQAVEDLTGYANDFAVFLNAANPNLPVDTVEQLVIEHVLTTKDAVDALAAGDTQAGFTNLREAMGHMHMIADPLSGAIAEQFPERFPGDTNSAASDLQRDLNLILQEHTYLAGAAVNEAFKGNDAAFEAAARALEGNTQDFVAAIESIYGPEAAEAFGGLWRSHIGMFVDYATGLITDDQAQADQAVEDLTGYATDFSDFLNDATGIDQAAAEELVMEHVLTVKEAVDTIDRGDGNPFIELREAGGHMSHIADPLAATIAEQQGL